MTMQAAKLLVELGDSAATAGAPIFVIEDILGDQIVLPPGAAPGPGELNPAITSVGLVCTGKVYRAENGEGFGTCRLACVMDREGTVDWLMVSPDSELGDAATTPPLGGRILDALRSAMGVAQ